MLVLARREGEKIWIGEHICIKVTQIDRGKVRIGITAPTDIPIHREELIYDRLTPAQQEVSNGTVPRV